MTRSTLLSLLLLAGCQEYEVRAFEAVDVFFQDPPPEVDVLFVIDNSGSMAGYQLLVGLRFDEFLYWFEDAGVDYHIGVTTTTMVKPTVAFDPCTQEDLDEMPDPGHLHMNTVITPETENATELFKDIVNVGICGSGDEQGLEAGRLALSEEMLTGPSFGFLREDASLSVIYISDEQDASFDPVWAFANDLYAVKGSADRDDVHASTMTITDTEECIVPVFGSSEGTRYVALAEMMGGVISNLCNNNFAESMVELSFEASRLQDRFVLTDLPKPESLQVTVNDTEVPCTSNEWTYVFTDTGDGTPTAEIVFDRDELPRPGARIAVRYDRGQGDPADFCPEPLL